MKAALLGTLIPLGYILCGLLTARGVLAYYVREDGTYDYRRNDPAPLALFAGVFWPTFILGYGIYCLFKSDWGLSWLLDPKPVRDRKRRSREAAARLVREKTQAATTMARIRARQTAAENDLPWPTMNPFVDDTGTLKHNPVGRPPMMEGK